jgi:hypothetical protein
LVAETIWSCSVPTCMFTRIVSCRSFLGCLLYKLERKFVLLGCSTCRLLFLLKGIREKFLAADFASGSCLPALHGPNFLTAPPNPWALLLCVSILFFEVNGVPVPPNNYFCLYFLCPYTTLTKRQILRITRSPVLLKANVEFERPVLQWRMLMRLYSWQDSPSCIADRYAGSFKGELSVSLKEERYLSPTTWCHAPCSFSHRVFFICCYPGPTSRGGKISLTSGSRSRG